MKKWIGYTKGMGIGGWLTNYKRFHVIPEDRRLTLTIGDFEHFDCYISEWDIQNIASMGLDHIRLGFDQVVIEDKPYTYREHTLELIDRFIQWCEKYNLNIVLNLHKAIGNYCDISEPVSLFDSNELQDRFIAMWKMLARHYAGKSNITFELLNEVRNIEPNKWNDLWHRCVCELRKIDPESWIVIGSICWNDSSKLKFLDISDDEHVIYTFHNYAPGVFTHQRGVLMADQIYYNREMPYPCDIERYRDAHLVIYNKENAYKEYKRMDSLYLENSIKGAFEFIEKNPEKILWCGEFGTIRHANIKWRENWMRDMISILQKHDIPYCVWNYLSTPNDGNRFSLVDDDTRKILSDEMLRIISGRITENEL